MSTTNSATSRNLWSSGRLPQVPGLEVLCMPQVREVGDGNINYVYILEGPGGSLCLKQGPPYVRVMQSWALSQVPCFTLLRLQCCSSMRCVHHADCFAIESCHMQDHVPAMLNNSLRDQDYRHLACRCRTGCASRQKFWRKRAAMRRSTSQPCWISTPACPP